ncbi:hypothetical protein D3C86_2168500 [compost metagenome]
MPYKADASIKLSEEFAIPIQTSETAKSEIDIFRIKTRPCLSDALPATKRMSKEVSVNTMKNIPLLLVPK